MMIFVRGLTIEFLGIRGRMVEDPNGGGPPFVHRPVWGSDAEWLKIRMGIGHPAVLGSGGGYWAVGFNVGDYIQYRTRGCGRSRQRREMILVGHLVGDCLKEDRRKRQRSWPRSSPDVAKGGCSHLPLP